jgi:NAD(P)-dependent dehydrogenase (short-subunit alcohol dehydrogenase family)
MSLVGKVAIVTGGGTGIGMGISRALAGAGARVAIGQRRKEIAESACEELRLSGHEAEAFQLDIRDRRQVTEMISGIHERWGGLDILVNNAAVTGARVLVPVLEYTDEILDEIFDVNLKGTFVCCQEAARAMAQRGGAIVNISSVGGFAGQESAAAYCATKSGIIGLTRALALDLAPLRIRVNCVAPGDIALDQNESAQGQAQQKGVSGKYFRQIPMGRPGTPEEIGKAVKFLASDDSSYMTGETIVVDGGFLIY